MDQAAWEGPASPDVEREFRPEEILATLSRHQVDFVVTGGAGAVLLGAELPTGDVDLIYPMTEPNLANIAAALKELQAQSKRYPGLPTDDLAALLSGSDLWRWETKFGDLDMMTWASGAPRDYKELRQRAEVLRVGEYDVMVASVDDLIAMKRTTGHLASRSSMSNRLRAKWLW